MGLDDFSAYRRVTVTTEEWERYKQFREKANSTEQPLFLDPKKERMIPPANMIQDESGGKEDERDQNETPKSPTANASQQETKVRLSCYYFLFIMTPE